MVRSMVKAASKTTDKPLGENLRYERKFIYENTNLDDLIGEVLINSYCFKEVFYRRTINNIYYDDGGFSYFHQNVSGDGKREKCRIRWYGDEFTEIENPTFEVKKKFGEVGDKISYKLKGYKSTLSSIDIKEFEHLVFENESKVNKSVISKFQQLTPALYNTYERRYFLSFCNRFRITLDYNMNFYNPNHKNYKGSHKSISQDEIILELKYDMAHDNESRKLTQQLRSRLSKNSKYVRGVEMVY